MEAYYFTFRSMTQAQTASHKLKTHGLSAVFLRAPKALSASGCGYAVKTDAVHVHGAVLILRNAGIDQWKLFRTFENGTLQEVFL